MYQIYSFDFIMLVGNPPPSRLTPSIPRAKVFGPTIRPADIGRALELGEFIAVFQPFVRPGSGSVAMFEATVRWVHPHRGLLGPCDFVCEADQYGMLDHIAVELIEQAALAVMDLSIPVSVNSVGAVLRTQTARLAIERCNAAFGLDTGDLSFGDCHHGAALYAERPVRLIDLADCDDTRAALTPHVMQYMGGTAIALTGVSSLLQWYVSAECGACFAQGDFICQPTQRVDIAAALQHWRSNFDAINAAAEFQSLFSPH